ncbi:MAG: M20/M25/M40 family metallo-hydrolase [Fimbriimonas sp.]
MRVLASLLVLGFAGAVWSGPKYDEFANTIRKRGLTDLGAYSLLGELTTDIGHRLSGSANAERAVKWGEAKMREMGLENVHLVPCKVPHWVRGNVELCTATSAKGSFSLTCCALGTSPGTPTEGISAEIVEVHSLDEVKQLGEKLRGKIVFYNRAFDPTLISGGAQYGAAGDQRFSGPATAAKVGAVATLVRSLTGDPDDVPHTGTTREPGIPSAALSVVAANRLSAALREGKVSVNLKLSCQNLPEVDSASVVGEIRGTQKPNEVIVMGGHLDSWDKGTGAHDDGAGVCHSLEAIRLLKVCGFAPKRTIRVVLFMNEEISGTGAEAYAEQAGKSKERHIAAIESDAGGFAPRSFGASGKNLAKYRRWLPALSMFEIERITPGGGGADIGPLAKYGTTLFGLSPEGQRYFDYHHSDKDTLDKVHPRELELGAMAMATLAWCLSEEGA